MLAMHFAHKWHARLRTVLVLLFTGQCHKWRTVLPSIVLLRIRMIV
jgi:hypothetical protein